MFPSYSHRTVHTFALAGALFFAQSATAQQAPQCTLSANPAMVSAGAASILTATCSPAATSYEWGGGTCAGTTNSTCTVKPSVTTKYSVFGTGIGGAGPSASAAVFATGPYDGIYQWLDGYYLSVHRIGGDILIGTIYWVYNANSVQVGTRTVSDSDTFDLFHGQIVDSRATMNGTRFYRGCTLSYDFAFNSDSSLTVSRKSVNNSPGVSVADVDCAARYTSEAVVRTIPKIF